LLTALLLFLIIEALVLLLLLRVLKPHPAPKKILV